MLAFLYNRFDFKDCTKEKKKKKQRDLDREMRNKRQTPKMEKEAQPV